MDGVQKRPLTGMISAGVAAPRAVGNGVATVVHTLDNLSDQNGGPYVDMVNLFVSNPTGGALNVSVIAAGGTPILIAVATLTTVQIFVDAVFQNAPGVAAVTITASGSGAGLVFFGDFARVL